jgi:hypothetical protein
VKLELMNQQSMPERPERADVGVVVCAVTDGPRIRLVFDDVRASSVTHPQDWRTTWFFTETSFDAPAFDAAELSDEDCAKIGRAVVARLAATRRR